MPKTEFAAGLDEIVRPVAAFLKDAGFRKSGRNFNRAVGDGLVQVLTFQMGRHEFRTQEIPGFAGDLHGRFTVNLGIAIPGLPHFQPWLKHASGKVVSETACCIRERLGQVMPECGDSWRAIRPPYEVVSQDVAAAITDHGLPFLERFRSCRDVTEHHARHGGLPGNTKHGGELLVALIHHHRGEPKAARAAFQAARASAPGNPHFVAHVTAIEADLLGPNLT